MDDQSTLNTVVTSLYRYAYFMTQNQDLSERIVFLVLVRARMMLSLLNNKSFRAVHLESSFGVSMSANPFRELSPIST
jgi:hypothetical protein